MTPIPEISQYFLTKKMNNIKFNFAKMKILEGHYLQGLKVMFDKKNYTNNKRSNEFRSNNIALEKGYDTWGSRVYAFYNDKNSIMLDFK